MRQILFLFPVSFGLLTGCGMGFRGDTTARHAMFNPGFDVYRDEVPPCRYDEIRPIEGQGWKDFNRKVNMARADAVIRLREHDASASALGTQPGPFLTGTAVRYRDPNCKS